YFPAGATVTNTAFCAFHNSFPSGANFLGDNYAVVTRCTPYNGGETALQAVTRVSSHEVVESATDPARGGYNFGGTPAQPWTTSSQLGPTKLFPTCLAFPGMQNGSTGSLRVQIPVSADAGDWAVFSIHSFEEDPANCYPYLHGDVIHPWLVGVYVP